jgi:hypothetical protein
VHLLVGYPKVGNTSANPAPARMTDANQGVEDSARGSARLRPLLAEPSIWNVSLPSQAPPDLRFRCLFALGLYLGYRFPNALFGHPPILPGEMLIDGSRHPFGLEVSGCIQLRSRDPTLIREIHESIWPVT